MGKSNNSWKSNDQKDQKGLTEEQRRKKLAQENAIKEMESLKSTVQAALDNNTFNNFIDNYNQVATISYRMTKNIEYALKNLETIDKSSRKFYSLSSLRFNSEIDDIVFKLQGLLLKISNRDCPRTTKTSNFYEIWRLYLKSAMDGCLIIRSINEASIGGISNYPLDSIIFNGQSLNEQTGILNSNLASVDKTLEEIDRNLKKLLDTTNKYPDKFDIQGMQFVVRETNSDPENMTKCYNTIKAVEKDLGRLFHKIESVDNANHFPLKIKTVTVIAEVLRHYLKMVLILRSLIDVNPLVFIQVYLEDRTDLGENAIKVVKGVETVMSWLVSHNGVVDNEGRGLYRKVIQELTQLSCPPKHGEHLSIEEIDKMNLNCFNKISNLTSWDLIVLYLLKGELFRLNVIFNAIYDVKMTDFLKKSSK